MVRSGDQDDVEIAFLEHLPIIGEGPGSLARLLARGDDLGRSGEHLRVNVTERDDLDRSDLDQAEQVNLAVPAGPDQADAFALHLGGEFRGSTGHRQGRKGQPSSAGPEELATFHDFASLHGGIELTGVDEEGTDDLDSTGRT